MSKNSYPYPPDEFDTVNPTSRPQEVHAARRSTWSRVWPFIVVIIVVPAIALGVVKVLSSWDNPGGEPADAGTVTATETITVTDPPPTAPSEDPSVGASTDDAGVAGEGGEAGGATEPVASEEPSDEPPPIDRTLPVQILNAKGEAGLAGRASDLLRQDGWTSVTPGDYEGEDFDGTSIVLYGKNAYSTSAQSVAGILQIAEVAKDTDLAPDGIVVVLRQDFALI